MLTSYHLIFHPVLLKSGMMSIFFCGYLLNVSTRSADIREYYNTGVATLIGVRSVQSLNSIVYSTDCLQ